MTSLVKGVVIVGAKRTPFGTYGGKLKNTSITEMQVVASKAALEAAKLDPKLVDSVNIGNIIAASSVDGAFLSRHVLLKCGIPLDRPALNVNRLCGSGFQALVNGVQDILTGVARISLTGGSENMSMAPHVVRNARFGIPLGKHPILEDVLWTGLTDSYCNLPMANTAENLAEKYNISREEVDKYALRSQQTWKAAQDAGIFKAEMASIQVKDKKGMVTFEVDEHPRPQTTMEGLAKLPTIFKKNGVVTAGSASGICDGAGAIIVASDEAAKEHGLTPMARVVGWSVVGVEPSIMGIGPYPAISNLLKKAGLTLNDIDLVEINEAFGAQTLACAKALELDMNKLNVNGGAIALGHPLGASGARITTHLVHELRRRKGKYGIGSACIGGGQGIAVLIENLS